MTFRFSLRALLIAVSLCGLLVAACVLAVRAIETSIDEFLDVVAEEYALMQVGDMMGLYGAKNAGLMPKNWQELGTVYAEVEQVYGLGPQGMDRLKQLVEIDFELLGRAGDGANDGGAILRLRRQLREEELVEVEVNANGRIRELLSGAKAD